MDYLGTKAIVPYAAHGMGQVVCLGTMDKWWYEGIDRRDGVELLKRCINEVETRKSQYAHAKLKTPPHPSTLKSNSK